MTLLTLTLVLSIISFFSSASVILRAIAPLIPDSRTHPLKRGNPTLKKPEQAYIWLAVTTILSVAAFVWEAFYESSATSGVDGQLISSIRIHLVLTVTPTCLCIITLITLLQARKAKASSFGPLHILIWVPLLIVMVVSSAVSGVVASVTARSVQIVTGSYLCVIAILNTVAMVCLVATLLKIRRNLSSFSDFGGPWEDLVGNTRPFPAEDVEALKDRSSWITSDPGATQLSISSFSFESQTEEGKPLPPANVLQRMDTGSRRENSWLSEPSTAPSTMPDWSFPTSKGGRAIKYPIQAEIQEGVLYPCTPTATASHAHFAIPLERTQSGLGCRESEKGLVLSANALPKSVNVSWGQIYAWLGLVWLPPILALPYIILGPGQVPISVLFIIAVSIPGPMLAFNAILCPLPIPTDLFGDVSDLPKPSKTRSRHRISGSMTVVKGCRSGDVWLSKGDAIDGKGKLSRATSLLTPVPKLSVLPAKSMAQEESPWRDEMQRSPSTFVAINTYCGNELGWLPDSEGRERFEGSSGEQSFHVRSQSSASSRRRFDFPTSVSRQSSTSSVGSVGSRASRPYRGAFATNLETIPDISMTSPPRPSRSGTPGGRDYSSPSEPCFTSGDTDHTSRYKDRDRLITSSPPPVGLTGPMTEVDSISLLSQVVPALLTQARPSEILRSQVSGLDAIGTRPSSTGVCSTNNDHDTRIPRRSRKPVSPADEAYIDFPKATRSASLASQATQEGTVGQPGVSLIPMPVRAPEVSVFRGSNGHRFKAEESPGIHTSGIPFPAPKALRAASDKEVALFRRGKKEHYTNPNSSAQDRTLR